ncbi:hypothetical protein [Candidatus Poriferisodalis sp.]|uniref:hypothetical protein n=1 Tax=Candidatus Poriferisodalis sp. TaxID=3101277 RepID=UPI003B01456E
MLRLAALGAVGCAAALWLLLADAGRGHRRVGGPTRWPWAVTGLAAFVAGFAFGPAAAGLAGAVVGICAWCAAVAVRSRQRVSAAESVAQFASILANQAQVSRTVVDALETAAPLATGPIARTAARFVSECRSVGVEAAAQRFATGAEGAVAAWLADAVAVAAASGGEWVPILGVLESEAAEDAATARHFHRHVAANLPQLALSAALGAAIALGSALVSPEAWEWLTGVQGQRVGLAAITIAALICARPLVSAWEQTR